MNSFEKIGLIVLFFISLIYSYVKPTAIVENIQTKQNIVIYVDTDSASRKGDIATIYERIGVGPKALQTYDCVRKKVFGSWSEKKLNALNENTTPSFEKACKSFWEFWK